ncbi:MULTISPECIES: Dps family protein [Cohnella]|uniref:Dps family protein n=1 Tax=Cohnella TaxID=329857 RepID=UPI0009B9B101|nr:MULTISPECIES: Dps family protein [Cohnella]MBN2984121.1 DNA starvation/stationary phase protection protein [Cohnella algarum]
MSNVASVLNQQVANWTVMYTKLHQYHWFVKGPHFFTLHEKFEELYNEASAHLDELAERLLAIGERPVSTLSESLKLASVKEGAGKESPEEMVAAIASDFASIRDELQKGIEIADKAKDEVTSDMLLGIQTGLEKHIWMLNAFLGKDVKTPVHA